jgi:NAD+ synthase
MQTQKIINYIVDWLSDYARKSNRKGFVVGVSGGVDSGVVSTLCAMTELDVLAMEMPIRQQKNQINCAQEHLKFLGEKFPNVKTMTVDLNEAFEAIYKTFNVKNSEFPAEKLAFANTRSRLRMLTLYYYGQIHELLVCGTGNKIEDFGIGFFTKYGDGGVDISPIADLYKTEVYELAKTLNLPKSIQNAIPTDGLWDTDRTDEQQIGATYPELEKIHKDFGKKTETDYHGRDLEVYKIFAKMNKAAQHKINPIPVCEIPKELLEN